MAKEKWAHAEEVEANEKTPLDPEEISAESYALPLISVEIGEAKVDEITPADIQISEYLDSNPSLKDAITNENLDIVAHKVKDKKDGKMKWVIIVGFGFAALALGIAGYKLIHKYKPHKKGQKK